MAFTATITNIQQSDNTLNVEVTYEDTDAGFVSQRVLNCDGGISFTDLQAKITELGQQLKSALSSKASLEEKIGTTITI